MSDLTKLLTERRRENGVPEETVAPAPTSGGTDEGTQQKVWEGTGKAARPELYDARRRLHAQLAKELSTLLYQQDLDPEKLFSHVRDKLARLLRDEQTPMSAEERRRLLADVESDVLGHGPIEEFLKDPEITEVMVNGPDQIYVERAGKIYKTNQRFADAAHLRTVIDGIVARVGRRIDESSPMVDARLADGSRVNAVVHPLAIDGPFLTIRKFSVDPLIDEDLISAGTFTRSVAQFLRLAVEGKLNILISGGTGAGKTTTLNVLSSYIPKDERIVTVEDAVELRMSQPHVLQLESRPPNIEGTGAVLIRDLVRNSLRMRPDRIVVGEVRGAEALDMLQAMNTGHDGSISTLHANTPRDAVSRLETMVLMAGMDLPIRAIREQITAAVDLIVHQSRLKDGSRRITHVTEVEGMEGDIITLQDVFLFDFSKGLDDHGRYTGQLKPTGVRPKFVQKLADQGVRLSPAMFIEDSLVGGDGA